MRHLKWIVVSLLLLTGSNAWGHDAKLQAELLDEVLRLSHAEVPDQIILEQIQAWGFVFELSADDIVELRTLGVSDTVIHALVQTAGWEGSEPWVSPARVYVSAGFYSPWYFFPYAWGGYCDPFPRLYAHYYYPFYYGVGFGYYGWCGSTYYAHYYPRAWHRRAWRHGDRRPPPSPYSVASKRPARHANPVVVPGSKQRGSRAATSPRVIRGSRERNVSTALPRGATLRTPEAARGVPATRAPARRVQRNRSAAGTPVLQPRQSQASQRVQTPSWRRNGSSTSRLERALPRQRTWSTPRASRSQPALSPNRSGLRVSPTSRMQTAPRMRSMPRMQSMPRSVPGAISSRFGAARSR